MMTFFVHATLGIMRSRKKKNTARRTGRKSDILHVLTDLAEETSTKTTLYGLKNFVKDRADEEAAADKEYFVAFNDVDAQIKVSTN